MSIELSSLKHQGEGYFCNFPTVLLARIAEYLCVRDFRSFKSTHRTIHEAPELRRDLPHVWLLDNLHRFHKIRPEEEIVAALSRIFKGALCTTEDFPDSHSYFLDTKTCYRSPDNSDRMRRICCLNLAQTESFNRKEDMSTFSLKEITRRGCLAMDQHNCPIAMDMIEAGGVYYLRVLFQYEFQEKKLGYYYFLILQFCVKNGRIEVKLLGIRINIMQDSSCSVFYLNDRDQKKRAYEYLNRLVTGEPCGKLLDVFDNHRRVWAEGERKVNIGRFFKKRTVSRVVLKRLDE